MKKTLLSIGLLAGAFGMANAQTFVSTDPSNRNAVLEEYTGFQCTFCPDGHRRANAFAEANPDRALLINIHAGGYANPGNSGFDLRTSFGDALANQTNLAGYPAGTMNRQEFDGLQQNGTGTAMGRANWTTAGSQILALPSPLNIAAQASLDIATRTLTVDVEAYYTGDAAEATNFINVALLQDHIVGPQIDAGTQVPDYDHNHVLRHLLTGQWGDEISTTTTGSFVSKQYTYVLPNTIGSELVNISNLEIAVFATETRQEVITGSMTEVVLSNFPFQNDAGILAVNTPNSVCGDMVGASVTFMNNGEQNLTALEGTYSINGGTSQSFTWTGDIAVFESAEIILQEATFSPEATNTFEVTITSVNGTDDESADNNTSSSDFSPADYAGTLAIDVIINTDQYGSETSWTLSDENGSTVASGGNYGDVTTGETHIQEVTLTEGLCYSFTINDSFGDGMCCDFGTGSYMVKDKSGRVFVSGGPFASSEATPFKSQNNVGIKEIKDVTVAVYPNPANGTIFLNLEELNGSETQIRVIDVVGKVVFNNTVQANGIETINVSALSNGIYTVNVSAGSFNSVSKISVLK
jgi:hypothetical protein